MVITKDYLLKRLEEVNKIINNLRPGDSLRIEWAGSPARPRITFYRDNKAMRDLSPRATNKEVYVWLLAFQDGIELALTEVKNRLERDGKSS